MLYNWLVQGICTGIGKEWEQMEQVDIIIKYPIDKMNSIAEAHAFNIFFSLDGCKIRKKAY